MINSASDDEIEVICLKNEIEIVEYDSDMSQHIIVDVENAEKLYEQLGLAIAQAKAWGPM